MPIFLSFSNSFQTKQERKRHKVWEKSATPLRCVCVCRSSSVLEKVSEKRRRENSRTTRTINRMKTVKQWLPLALITIPSPLPPFPLSFHLQPPSFALTICCLPSIHVSCSYLGWPFSSGWRWIKSRPIYWILLQFFMDETQFARILTHSQLSPHSHFLTTKIGSIRALEDVSRARLIFWMMASCFGLKSLILAWQLWQHILLCSISLSR